MYHHRSIASKKNYEDFKNFDAWLSENEEELGIFVKEIKNFPNPKEIIKKCHEKYRETYGPRKNFIKIIVNTYES